MPIPEGVVDVRYDPLLLVGTTIGGWVVEYEGGITGPLSRATDQWLKDLNDILSGYSVPQNATPAQLDAILQAGVNLITAREDAERPQPLPEGDPPVRSSGGYDWAWDPETGGYTDLIGRTPPKAAAGLTEPQFYTDPNTGQQWVRTTPDGPWQAYEPPESEQEGQVYETFEEAQANTPPGFRPTQLTNGMWGFEREPQRDYWQQIEDLITGATGPDDYQRAFELADVWDNLTRQRITPMDAFNFIAPIAQNPVHFQELWNSLAEQTGRGTPDFTRMWEQARPGVALPVAPPGVPGIGPDRLGPEQQEIDAQVEAQIGGLAGDGLGPEPPGLATPVNPFAPSGAPLGVSGARPLAPGEVANPFEPPGFRLGLFNEEIPEEEELVWDEDTQGWVPRAAFGRASAAAGGQSLRSLTSALSGPSSDQYVWRRTPQGAMVQMPRRGSSFGTPTPDDPFRQALGAAASGAALQSQRVGASAAPFAQGQQFINALRQPQLPILSGQGPAFGGTEFFPIPPNADPNQEKFTREWWNEPAQRRFLQRRPLRTGFR